MSNITPDQMGRDAGKKINEILSDAEADDTTREAIIRILLELKSLQGAQAEDYAHWAVRAIYDESAAHDGEITNYIESMSRAAGA